jgi:hypothetical protein
LGWVTVVASAAAEPAPAPPEYGLDVRIDPAVSRLECTAEVLDPRSSIFTLARDLAVERVEADGQAVAFRESVPTSSETARKVTLDGPPPGRLVIKYAGTFRPGTYPEVIRQVNGIGPDRVELAGYVDWYPRLQPAGAFSFRLRVDVPTPFETVTNAELLRSESAEGRTASEWQSYEPTGDVVLLSAPGLGSVESEGGDMKVEIHSSALSPSYVESMKDDVARVVAFLSDLMETPPPTRVVRIAYSPRAGWGYVRSPLIVVSEASARSLQAQPFGQARDLRYITHEVAHYWWHLADASTPEDWINEGLAEYTALLAVEALVGREFADRLLEEYRERSGNSATEAPIAETDGASRDREVNRYVRPVLLLEEVRQRNGNESMDRFLQALCRRFTEDEGATTSVFLEQAGRSFGAEESTRLSEALYSKEWGDPAALRPHVLIPGETVFLGTWAGPLTQAGATLEVVLHLVEEDGALAATLESPDQGASDIPVPTVGVRERVLTFGLGAFGVAFRGVLSPDGTAIEGQWTQGGMATPLKLSKVVGEP